MSPAPRPFTVELVGQANAHLNHLATRSEQLGLQEGLVELLTQILDNLETRPRDWGDPYLNYRGLNAVAYGRTIVSAQLRVEYTVHNTQPLVWLSALIPLEGSPFKDG